MSDDATSPNHHRGWADRWTPDKQRYLDHQGPIFTNNLTVFEPPIPADWALELGHLDFTVQLSGATLPAAPVPGLRAPSFLVRGPIPGVDPEPVVLPGPVDPSFQLRQPAEVVGALADFFPVVAAGPLMQKLPGLEQPAQGARYAAVFDAGRAQVPWGSLRHHLLLKEPTCLRDEAMTLEYCPYWVAGQALLSMDNLSATVAPVVSIRRTSMWRRELADGIRYFRLLAQDGFQEYLSLLERMARHRLSEDELTTVLEEVYPRLDLPETARAKVARGLPLSLEERMAAERAATQNRYQGEHYPLVVLQHYRQIGGQHPDLAGSSLALYLAVCRFEDRRWTRNTDYLTQEALFSAQTRSRHRAKVRAFTQIYQLS